MAALAAGLVAASPAAANTTLAVGGCSGTDATRIEVPLGGGSAVTERDCRIAFGSSDSSAMLRLLQADAAGAAMWRGPDGDIDTTWGTGGVTRHDPSPGTDVGGKLARTPDGGYAVGFAYNGGTLAVLRLDADGALVTSFGTNGVATFDLPGGIDGFADLAVQRNGRIVVVGGAGTALHVVRFRADGQVDTTFSGDGRFATDLGGTIEPHAVTIRPDGRIVVVAQRQTPTTAVVVLQLDSNGAIDTTFAAPRGWLQFDNLDSPSAAAIDDTGRVLVAGSATLDSGVARVLADGTLDSGWGSGGVAALTELGMGHAFDVTLDHLGRVLVGGTAGAGMPDAAYVARLLDDGSLDGEFATDGAFTWDPVPGAFDAVTALTVLDDGSIAAAAASDAAGVDADGAAILLRADGGPMPGFGSGGVAPLVATASEQDVPYGVAGGPDGSVVFAGSARYGGLYEVTTARMVGSALPDYDAGGTWSTGSAAFGACLRGVSGPAAATWTANATCAANDGGWWRAVPAGAAGSEVASTTVAGATTASADLRFGVRIGATTDLGRYVAPITVEVIAPDLEAPTNTMLPSISGTEAVRKLLTASAGTWTGSGTISYAYQWQRCTPGCADIPGADAKTYLLDPADAGATIRVVVTASNSEGSASATSGQTGVIAAAPATGLYYMTGFEHQTTSEVGGGILGEYIGTGTGTQSIDTEIVRSGNASLRFNTSGNNLQWDVPIGSGTQYTATARMYIYIASMPSGSLTFSQFETNATYDSFCEFGVAPGGIGRMAFFNAGAWFQQNGVQLETDRWHLIEYACDFSTTTWRAHWRVDGVAQPSLVQGGRVARHLEKFQLGVDLAATADVRFDDVAVSRTSADYPLGPGTVLGHLPNGIGAISNPSQWFWSTNNMSTATAFGAGDANQSPGRATLIDDWPVNTGAGADLIEQAWDGNTLNVRFADSTASRPPTSVSVFGAQRESSTGANSGTARAVSGGTTTLWTENPSGGTSTVHYYRGTMATAPGGSPWTLAALNALEVQLSGSDVTPDIWTDALLVEADYPVDRLVENTGVPTISGTPRTGSTLSADPGSWTPTPTSYAYRWQRCNASGASCSDIAGATASTYVLQGADQGNTVRVRVLARTDVGNQTAVSAPTSVIAAGAPSLTYFTGFEHGTISTSGNGLFDEDEGTPVVEATPLARSGTSAMRITSTGATDEFVTRAVSGSTAVMRFAIMFPSLPTVGGELAEIHKTGAGFSCDVDYDAATNRFRVEMDPGVSSNVTVEPGRWYLIDIRCSYASSTHRIDWMIDGVPQPPLTDAWGSSGTIDAVALGSGGTTKFVGTAYYDDWAVSMSSSDYPLGAGRVEGLRPNAAGTHSTISSFQTTTNGGSSWQAFSGSDAGSMPGSSALIDDWPLDWIAGVSGDVIRQTSTSGYLEYELEDGRVDAPPNAVRVIGTHHAGNAGNTQNVTVTARLGGSGVQSYSYDPPAATARSFAGGIHLTRPGGGAWTASDVDSLRLRLSSSNVGGSTSDRPWTHALMAEVDYPAGAMPRNVTPPGIAADHDAPKVGDVLGVDAGTWAGPDSDGRRYQWLRCDASGDACLPIAGASGATYELTPADAGARLRVVELAVGEAGTQGARSAASELISTVPSPVFLTGFEHGTMSANGGGIISTLDAGSTATASVARSGDYSMVTVASGSSSEAEWHLAPGATTAVARYAMRVDSIPGSAATVLEMQAGSGSYLRSRVTSSGVLQMQFYDTGQRGTVNGPTLVPNRWYVVDVRLDTSSATWRLDWRVDGATQPSTSYAVAGGATTIDEVQWGVSNSATLTTRWDDVLISRTATDFPIGNGRVEAMPVKDVADAPVAGNFGPGSSSTWAGAVSQVPMTSTASYLAQTAITSSATDHVAFALADPPDERRINGVRGLVSYGATAAGTSHVAARVQRPGDTLAAAPTVFDGNPETASLSYGGAVVPAPAGGWSAEVLRDLRWLVGFSTDVSPNPRVHDLLVEVDYRP